MTLSRKDSCFTNLDAAGLNGGPRNTGEASDYVTPQPRIFTRSHAAVPEIDAVRWRLAVGGLVEQPLQLSLSALRAEFPVHDLTATLMCAGLRRQEFLRMGPLPGELPWGGQPVANVRWSGVSLTDVLNTARVMPNGRHVGLTGLDLVERHGERFGFGGSIPIEKARDRDVLLAFQLDGEPLPPAHGFPVRLVVPGWIGARSVKWLGRIDLSSEPSNNYFRVHAYRVQRAVAPGDPRDVTAGEPLEEIWLNSMIVAPAEQAQVRVGPVDVSGWAIGRNAGSVSRVELSPDGGTSWVNATILPATDRWTWRLWQATLRVQTGSHELVVRAWDDAGQTQPELIAETWNVKGYANNAWHRVAITVTA